jgi:hypothetical protein
MAAVDAGAENGSLNVAKLTNLTCTSHYLAGIYAQLSCHKVLPNM